ncbi:MAG: PIN domain-containing protein [Deltaproteobacteria bacterium]
MIVFADACYWIALLNPGDSLNRVARARAKALKSARILTTDFVLVEVLNFFCERGTDLRMAAHAITTNLVTGSAVDVVPGSRETFMQGLDLYGNRPDKQYSHTDCVSFEVMRRRNLKDALTNDHHFEQEGFRALLKGEP